MDTDASLSQQLNASSGSFELVLSAALLGGLGFGVDRWLGTTPWLTIGFTVFGLVGSIVSIYYRYRAQMARFEPARVDER